MEKRINKILLRLKVSLFLVWIIFIGFVVMGELGLFADYTVEPGSEEEFILNCVAVCLTLIGVPLSLKFYNLCTAHSLRRMDNDEALSSYQLHGLIRNAMMLIIAVIDIVIYYVTANGSFISSGSITGALCGMIVIIVTLSFWPRRAQIDDYMEKVNMDE